jgi:hypothetical protein
MHGCVIDFLKIYYKNQEIRNWDSMFWLRELTSQYGSLNMMLRLLMPCLCTWSSFALTLFLQHYSHVSHSLPHFTISDATTHMGAIMFSIPHWKHFKLLIGMNPWQIMMTPTKKWFFQFIRRLCFFKWATRWASHETFGNKTCKKSICWEVMNAPYAHSL